MATIKSTQLTIGPGSQSSKAKVTVTSAFEFTHADAGDWKASIKLFGDDTSEGGGSALIYTFKFGPGQLSIFKKDYKVIQATPGTMNISETREIDWTILDEDPGQSVPQNAPPGTPGLPLKDEVFASVSLSRDTKSNVWTSFGV